MSVELCRSRMFESECCNCWVTGYRYVINEVIKWKPTYTRTQIALGNITETTGERQQQVQKKPQYKLCQFGQEAVVRVCSINTTYWVNTHSSHGANTLCFVSIFLGGQNHVCEANTTIPIVCPAVLIVLCLLCALLFLCVIVLLIKNRRTARRRSHMLTNGTASHNNGHELLRHWDLDFSERPTLALWWSERLDVSSLHFSQRSFHSVLGRNENVLHRYLNIPPFLRCPAQDECNWTRRALRLIHKVNLIRVERGFIVTTLNVELYMVL